MTMLEKLKVESEKTGLKMNIGKTKIMINIPEVRNFQLPAERLIEYIYLGHKIILGFENHTAEVVPMIALAWAVFYANKQTLRGKIPHLKVSLRAMRSVMPVLVYGTETMTLAQKSAKMFQVAQRGVERAMLVISRHRKGNA
ncbi:uncharacterized protein LOC113236304 [Hyposmocoma kahamanoa]|uniref:uncharacterized protein LOC113236304 n=1 Tax=Hyposmocoma kahamanoa TaxID=1477025 RepID=UPI000E6D5EDE|nr:uncharacterized protein LOC113236304 [Hyposmocoma kahamanoa]